MKNNHCPTWLRWVLSMLSFSFYTTGLNAQDREVRTFNFEFGISQTWQNTELHDINTFMSNYNDFHNNELSQSFSPIKNVSGPGYFFSFVLRGEKNFVYTTGVSTYLLKSDPSTALFNNNYGRELTLYYNLVDFNLDGGWLIGERIYLGWIWGCSYITSGITSKRVFPDGNVTAAKAPDDYGVFMTETGLFSLSDNLGYEIGFQFHHFQLNYRWNVSGLLIMATNAMVDPSGSFDTYFHRNYRQPVLNYEATDYAKGKRQSIQLVFLLPATSD